MANTKLCIKKIDNAINKVKEAQNLVSNKMFEEAENHIVDTVQLIAEILHLIKETDSPCEVTDAIPIIDIKGTDGLPVGVVNLQQDNKYITPSGIIINWIDSILIVSEPYPVENIWSVYGAPLQLKDGVGEIQRVITDNGYFALADGSKIIVISNCSSPIIMVRFFLPETQLTIQNLQGINLVKTIVYENAGLKKKLGCLLDTYLNPFLVNNKN
jgi:hypothetical protein